MGMITGEVEAISTKFGKFGILVGGKWYNTNPEWINGDKPNKGDTVEFDDGGRNYLKKLKILGGGSAPSASAPSGSGGSSGGVYDTGFPLSPTNPKRTINRQNALTNAVSYVNNNDGEASPEEVIAVARIFEAYTCGDLDVEEAKEALTEMDIG